MAETDVSVQRPHPNTADQVFHVADFCNHYPGEEVVFQTTLKVGPRQAGRTLTVQLPVGTGLAGYTLPDGVSIRSSAVRDLEEGPAVDWTLGDDLAPGGVLTFVTRATLL